MTTGDMYVWITRWDEFQHYKPERDRAPAWIKDYTKQMNDDRYLRLTDRQRALLRDLRDVFAVTFARLPRDTRVISRHRHRQTFRSDLDALEQAGLIEQISRETLERRLEKLYTSRAPARSKEKEEEEREPPKGRTLSQDHVRPEPHYNSPAPSLNGANAPAPSPDARNLEKATRYITNAGSHYDNLADLERDLQHEYDLTAEQAAELVAPLSHART